MSILNQKPIIETIPHPETGELFTCEWRIEGPYDATSCAQTHHFSLKTAYGTPIGTYFYTEGEYSPYASTPEPPTIHEDTMPRWWHTQSPHSRLFKASA